jgi:hypothetical protein
MHPGGMGRIWREIVAFVEATFPHWHQEPPDRQYRKRLKAHPALCRRRDETRRTAVFAVAIAGLNGEHGAYVPR